MILKKLRVLQRLDLLCNIDFITNCFAFRVLMCVYTAWQPFDRNYTEVLSSLSVLHGGNKNLISDSNTPPASGPANREGLTLST